MLKHHFIVKTASLFAANPTAGNRLQEARAPKLAVAYAAVLILSWGLASGAAAQAQDSDHNDHMFPAAPAARRAIDFDQRGFLIDGKRTFITSASLDYPRVPAALWADRLLRLKRAGFNTVEFYTFWDFHEPREGQFVFTGDHDLDAFLKLVKSLGMYAIARVGPYYCGEWSLGGYPIWLRFKPGVVLRTDNAPFLKAVDNFWDRLLPIVAANQISRGGSVILVQLENEHPLAWGTRTPTPYFTHLREQALKHGIEVPYFFSGMHHGSDPAGDAPSFDEPSRPNPWISTEFWSVWFSQYGSHPADAPTYRRRTWKLIAHGADGYNIYMGHGGSNFEYSNNNEDAASYDYGGPVGQGGDLRPTYYEFKKANYFARSFANVLGNSTDHSAPWASASSNHDVKLTARKGPAGEIVFADFPPPPVEKVASPDPNNPTFEAVTETATARTLTTTTISADGASFELALQPGEIVPLIHGVQIAPGVTLDWSSARILGMARFGHTTTLVAFGDAGRRDTMIFSGTSIQPEGSRASTAKLTIAESYPAAAPLVRSFSAGSEHVRVLLMTREQADRTWFSGEPGQELVITGPAYLGEANVADGKLTVQAESPWLRDMGGGMAGDVAASATVYGESAPLVLPAEATTAAHLTTLPLTPWETRTGSAAQPDFDDKTWTLAADPIEMGADGDLSSYAWYRSKVNVPQAGNYLLTPSEGGDHAKLYVDGHFVTEGSFSARPLPLILSGGSHTIAIFASHYGRQKFFANLGEFKGHDPKGLAGPVVLRQGATQELTAWRIERVLPGESTTVPPATDNPGWKPYKIGGPRGKRTPENAGAAWFQSPLPPVQPGGRRVLRFTSVDESATVYVGETLLGSFKGRDQAFSVEIPASLSGALRANVLVRGAGRPHGITGPVFLEQTSSDLRMEGWRSHGGPEVTATPVSWVPLAENVSAGVPVFFHSTFNLTPEALNQSGITWRISTEGLGHGSVWLNGHNLGRYPERIPVDGEFMPQGWMHAGSNEIVLYDEDGRAPRQVRVYAEPAASRDLATYHGVLIRR